MNHHDPAAETTLIAPRGTDSEVLAELKAITSDIAATFGNGDLHYCLEDVEDRLNTLIARLEKAQAPKCEIAGSDPHHGILVCGLDAGHDPDDGHRDVEKQAWFFVRGQRS